jgi:transposase
MPATAPAEPRPVVVGVDTHADVHVAAIVDTLGRTLASRSVPTTSRGYADLLA